LIIQASLRLVAIPKGLIEAPGSKSRFMLCSHARALGELRGLLRMPTKSQKKRNRQREERRIAYGMLDSTDVWGKWDHQ
jgi:hypothetical protein